MTGDPQVLVRVDAATGQLTGVSPDGRGLWPGPASCAQLDDQDLRYARTLGSPGTLVPCVTGPGEVTLLNVADGTVAATLSHDVADPVAVFVLDDQLFVTSGEQAQVIDVGSGEVLLTAPFALPPVEYGLTVSPDYLFILGETGDGFEIVAIDRDTATIPWRQGVAGQPVVLGNHVVLIDRAGLAFRGVAGM